jgi:hypothetical protein
VPAEPEIPVAPEEAPEECEGPECEPVDPAETEAPKDEVDATVEPENIPTVVPGDDVTDSNSAIAEEDESDDEILKVDPAIEAPVGEAVKPGKSNIALGTAIGIGAVVAAATPFVLVKVVIPFLRVTVYSLYHARTKFSEYLEIQAELIEANATDLQYSSDSNLSDEDKKKVVKKQLKWAKRLREWSNKFSIDNKKANNEAKKDIDKDEKEKKTINRNSDGDDAIF